MFANIKKYQHRELEELFKNFLSKGGGLHFHSFVIEKNYRDEIPEKARGLYTSLFSHIKLFDDFAKFKNIDTFCYLSSKSQQSIHYHNSYYQLKINSK
jgi:hypothetical protein